MGERIFQANRADVGVAPQALTANVAVNSGWLPMKKFAMAAVMLMINGVLAAGHTVTLLVRQAQDAGGTGAKTLKTLVIEGAEAAGSLRMAFTSSRRAVLTLLNVIATDAITLGSGDGAVVLTFVTTGSGSEGALEPGEVLVGANDTAAATNLTAAINAVEGYTATRAGLVITVLADADLVVTTADTTITIVKSAVADGDTVTVNGNVLKFLATGTGTAGAALADEVLLSTTDALCATNLAAKVTALDGVSAAVVANANPAAVDVAPETLAGVTATQDGSTLTLSTLVEHAVAEFDVSELDVNAGFNHVGFRVTSTTSGVTAAVALLRGGSRAAVRQDV